MLLLSFLVLAFLILFLMGTFPREVEADEDEFEDGEEEFVHRRKVLPFQRPTDQ